MKVIRPIQAGDFDALHQIAIESGHGFTSLPVNEELLLKRINRAETAFSTHVEQPGDESYLFVMEDSETGEVVGTSGIEAGVGLDDAFYHYHLGKVVHSSRELGIYNTVDTLSLCNDYTGATEICTLFLRETHRQGNNGRLLSKFRFLFIEEHKQRFAETIIAEMRGISDENGKSPFWAWLEEHFFSMDFPTADYLTGIGNKVFIAELMPKYPIYVNLLSQEAQEVIGKVHRNTEPAIRLLKSEGFECTGYVDIFDAGPTVEAQRRNIRSARNSQVLAAKIGEPTSTHSSIICNTAMKDFRAVAEFVDVHDDHAIIKAEVAEALNVKDGDNIRFVAF